ncbi:MAG: hypothetical protein HWN65_21660 [Candidatus Helarchaeota archaeon]|nr:hypothetical protein [Candidatus Helarchaeota archaeon]
MAVKTVTWVGLVLGCIAVALAPILYYAIYYAPYLIAVSILLPLAGLTCSILGVGEDSRLGIAGIVVNGLAFILIPVVAYYL